MRRTYLFDVECAQPAKSRQALVFLLYLRIEGIRIFFSSPKGQNGTLNVTLEERAILDCISKNNRMLQKEIATAIGKSERTVKRIMASLSQKGMIVRKNGKRNGWWEIQTVKEQ